MFGLLKSRVQAKGRIGIALGRDGVAIAVLRRDAEGPRLERCEVLPLAGAGGTDAVTVALRAAGLPRLPMSAVLRVEEYQLALVEAPDVPPAELRAAMRWRLKETIDFRVEDAVIDVFDMPSQHRGGQRRMMYAVAARREAVERWSAALAFMSALDVVDVPELCLRNLAANLPNSAGGVALLHLGPTVSTVILVRGSTFYFARQMDLQATQKTTRVPLDGAAAATEIIDAGTVVLELQRSLDYYERHFDQPPITRISISPFGARAQALATNLKLETGFDVTALDINALLPCAALIEPDEQAACLMAVGAALRAERRTL